MVSKEEIQRRLWNGANELRGSMDASRYKDYMLGLMFYKFLSDKTLKTYASYAKSKATGDDLVKEYLENTKKFGELNGSNKLIQNLKKTLGYYVLPNQLYQSWMIDINEGNFELENVSRALGDFEKSVNGSSESGDFTGLFSNLDLTDTALGSDLKHRSDNIKSLIKLFADLNMVELQENDILGDAYEYLIGMFALESGKKAGEFYTPHYVSEIIAQIAAKSSDIKSIYDPTVGSGSLLLTVRGHLDEEHAKELHYYGQEKNTATYNLTRMNLLLHGVNPKKMDIKNGDTLAEDWPEDPTRPGNGIAFDAIVMNPPYSAKNWNRSGLKGTDPRFEYLGGILPPDNKGDYAFLMHGLYHLDTNGTMGIVLPHGVLFRGAAEGEIRQSLVDKELIDAIIGLPEGMFTNTDIPVIIMVLKKNRKIGTPVLIFDASEGYEKQGKQNVLRERDIAKIVDAYIARQEIPGFCHLATKQEIIANDYNLNILRYVNNKAYDLGGDVEAHLLGGIPESDIKKLNVLNELSNDVINKSFSILRKGYLKMEFSIDTFSNQIIESKGVQEKITEIKAIIINYSKRYFEKIQKFERGSSQKNVIELKNEMLLDIMDKIKKFDFIDDYEAYQLIANLWKDNLTKDFVYIAEKGYFEAGRTTIPNMIIKGQGKERHEEQDGVKGAIVPNNLVAKIIFSDIYNEMIKLQEKVLKLEEKINQYIKDNQDESNDNAGLLDEALNAAGDGITKTKLGALLKLNNSNKTFYEEVQNVLNEKSTSEKSLKIKQKELKEKVMEKIPNLTNEEINIIMEKKWFSTLQEDAENLVLKPVENEINKVKKLYEDYGITLNEIDNYISKLEKDIEEMSNQLVVTK